MECVQLAAHSSQDVNVFQQALLDDLGARVDLVLVDEYLVLVVCVARHPVVAPRARFALAAKDRVHTEAVVRREQCGGKWVVRLQQGACERTSTA